MTILPLILLLNNIVTFCFFDDYVIANCIKFNLYDVDTCYYIG
jgi:hypothetical protein